MVFGIIGNQVGAYLFKRSPRYKAFIIFGILGKMNINIIFHSLTEEIASLINIDFYFRFCCGNHCYYAYLINWKYLHSNNSFYYYWSSLNLIVSSLHWISIRMCISSCRVILCRISLRKCLDGWIHDWKYTITIPRWKWKRSCLLCISEQYSNLFLVLIFCSNNESLIES